MTTAATEPVGDHPDISPTRRKRVAACVWIAVLLVAVVLYIYPIRTAYVRLGLLLSALSVWFGAILLCRIRVVRVGMLAITAISLGFLILPGRASDSAALRSAYLDALGRYEGSLYVWGGENRRGIDCSGLIRIGLMDAEMNHGLGALNPAAVRAGISIWWNDLSAQALRDGAGGAARTVCESKSINDADYTMLQAGDFAVTSDGVHTLAYLGNRVWIEADPGGGRVIKVTAPSANPWFHRPIRMMRWKRLDSGIVQR